MSKQSPEIQRGTSDADQALVIEVQLRQLAAERCNLLRQLNGVRAATRSLPPEILAEIFTINKTPLPFGATCSLWRDIAWGTPQLWTTIQCGSAKSPKASRWNEPADVLHLLRLFLKNSGHLKVTIDLHIDKKDVMEIPEAICSVLAIVTKEQSDKIRQLTLNSCNWAVKEWTIVYPFLHTANFLNLEGLHLSGDLLHSTFRNAPRLRQLSVLHLRHAGNVLRHQSFWNQLTILRLEATMVTHCLGLLQHHPPNLDVFECIDPMSDSRSVPNSGATEIIAPPRLTSFGWTGQLGNFEEYFWRHIRLPSVRNLTWNHPSSLSESCAGVRHDFFRSLPSLQVLHIQQYHGICELRDMLRSLESLRELHLDARQLEREGVDVMDVLTLMNDPDHENLLQNLKVLQINVLVGHGLSRMLCSRRDGPLSIGEIRCNDMTHRGIFAPLDEAVIFPEEPAYEEEEREALRGLIKGGLRLDIISGGERLSWCRNL